MFLVRILNAPKEPEGCMRAVQYACFEMKELELGVSQLLIECPTDLAHIWTGQPTIVVVADVCFPAEEISKETRRKFARKIASAVARSHGAKHRQVKVIVRNFCPEEVMIHRLPAK